jgi:hypothetical protein
MIAMRAAHGDFGAVFSAASTISVVADLTRRI